MWKALCILASICPISLAVAQTNFTAPPGFVLVPSGALSTNNAGLVAFPASAAVPGVTAPDQNFLQSTLNYFTSFDTNSTTFGTNGNFQAFTGVKFQSGINEGAVLGIEAQPFKGLSWFTLRDMATMADTVGTVAENEIDIGAFWTHNDVRFGGFVGADTLIQKDRWTPILGIEVQKALTKNAFSGIDLGRRIDDKDRGALALILEAGFTF